MTDNDIRTPDSMTEPTRKRVRVRRAEYPGEPYCTALVPIVGTPEDQSLFETVLKKAGHDEREAMIDCYHDVMGRDGEPAAFIAALHEGSEAVLRLGQKVEGEDLSRRSALFEALQGIASVAPDEKDDEGDEDGEIDDWNAGAYRIRLAAMMLARPENAQAYDLMHPWYGEAVKKAIETGWIYEALDGGEPDEADITNREVFGDLSPWDCGLLDDALTSLVESIDAIEIVCDEDTPQAVRRAILTLAELDRAIGPQPIVGHRIGPERLVAAMDARELGCWDERLLALRSDLSTLADGLSSAANLKISEQSCSQPAPEAAEMAARVETAKEACRDSLENLEEVIGLGWRKCRRK